MSHPASEPIPRISVVICTRNRPDKIGAAVASVLANDHTSFDLTVIDQSTDSATGDQLLSLGEPRLNYVHSSEPGLSRAYNNGIRRSSAPTIAFTDDDCRVPTDWLRRIEEAFVSEPDADLLYGQVLPYEHASAMYDGPGYTPTLQLTRAERLSRKDGFRVVGMGANFAARRQLFERIGGFDEVLGGGGPLRSSQDFDLAYRTYRSGSVILLSPEVTLLHDGERRWEDWRRLFRDYGIGDGAFYAKHVRCGDLYASSLLMGQIWRRGIRTVGISLLAHGRDHKDDYLSGVFVGIKQSLKFKIDRRIRCYAAT